MVQRVELAGEQPHGFGQSEGAHVGLLDGKLNARFFRFLAGEAAHDGREIDRKGPDAALRKFDGPSASAATEVAGRGDIGKQRLHQRAPGGGEGPAEFEEVIVVEGELLVGIAGHDSTKVTELAPEFRPGLLQAMAEIDLRLAGFFVLDAVGDADAAGEFDGIEPAVKSVLAKAHHDEGARRGAGTGPRSQWEFTPLMARGSPYLGP